MIWDGYPPKGTGFSDRSLLYLDNIKSDPLPLQLKVRSVGKLLRRGSLASGISLKFPNSTADGAEYNDELIEYHKEIVDL